MLQLQVKMLVIVWIMWSAQCGSYARIHHNLNSCARSVYSHLRYVHFIPWINQSHWRHLHQRCDLCGWEQKQIPYLLLYFVQQYLDGLCSFARLVVVFFLQLLLLSVALKWHIFFISQVIPLKWYGWITKSADVIVVSLSTSYFQKGADVLRAALSDQPKLCTYVSGTQVSFFLLIVRSLKFCQKLCEDS